ncbi:MAG: type III pantothenate kinase [Haliscomenobacteraceae bacterium CHB4]|nr:type III pantothenate kinase [Haliscomenobacteraceae bacterium CHB4]
MNLALDIGNTRIKAGLFRGNELAEQAIWTSPALAELQEFGNRSGVENVIVSSVAEPDESLQVMLAGNFKVLELTHRTPLPFKNHYKTPETLGKDRLAGVAGAQALYPGKNCLVVDCGTCIKYDMLTGDGVYHGGNIAPGARMRIAAMHHFTARLPEVEMRMPDDFTGFSTETALQNGALRGAVLEIQGFTSLYELEYGVLHVILTGGDAVFFQPHLSAIRKLIPVPDLTLIGLNHILQYNTSSTTSVNP